MRVTCAVAPLLTGCGRRDSSWQSYEEASPPPPAVQDDVHRSFAAGGPVASPDAMPPAHAAPAVPLRWAAPAGWTEQPGTGMRLATLTIRRGDRSGTCTLITLRGEAGGLEANVRRWIGQLEAPVPSTNEFAAFLDRKERFRCEGGFEGVLVDLTPLAGQGADVPSMMAGIVTVGDSTLFLKFTGPASLLKEEMGNFAALCRSVKSGS